MSESRKIFLLIALGILSLFPNINLYEFRGEESLRTIVAFEMADSHNYLQPTFLGDLYFNKPPLFNWFIVLSSKLIPWSELTARIVSILFVFLTVFLIYRFSYKLFKNTELALLSGLLYLISVDILFWYGYLAEIDVTLAFFVFLMFYIQYKGYFERNNYFVLLSGITACITFLLKGFPAFLFFGVTYICFVLYRRDFRYLLNPFLWLSGILAITIPTVWIFSTSNPEMYIKRLFIESVIRAEGSSDITKLLVHFITYPLLNIKQLIPASVLVAVILFFAYRNRAKVQLPSEIKLFLFVAFVNYLPYLLAVHSRGRYVIPLFPIIMVVSGYIIHNIGREKWIRIAIYTAVVLIMARFILGFVGFPIFMEKKASRKRAAYDIAKKIDLNSNIACDCKSEKTVCLYIDFLKGKAVKTSRHTPNWDYLIDCSDKSKGKEILSYDLRGKILKVYKRVK
ncbi:Dolichyl-phosphate-mannose-protein mannosyltransferase [Persephonella hydrogeniphila]|uniref:Dolichyl-phosphate-mannose-protein mannosyltransferase n=1 Tax=Persephonella hydrogeniphila TaxID=198703 RepID=A0A285NEP1_9AQUI|nr:Dolichyl-phosphate-mannose-protein mannosyltransferase [Persephonella hydrogeniphila]